MKEYDWTAVARAYEEGRLNRPLPELLRMVYELGVSHGGNVPDFIDDLEDAIRAGASHLRSEVKP